MGSSRRIYGGAVRTLSFVFIVVGVALLVTTFANDGGALSLGTFLGIGFVGIGVARLWMSGLFRGRRDERA